MKKIIYNFRNVFFIFILIVLYSCAHVEAPTGGIKDIIPPVVLNCEPPNYSPNFKADKIKINFDEFVALNNLTQQLVISPTFKENPEFILRKKTLLIRLAEKPKDSTTYNIFMGDAIADINENNILSNFQYVFSTGTYVDSLIIRGKITDAYTLKPDKDIFILLYETNADTMPLKSKPTYITKADAKGNFIFRNLKPNKYKIFALKDMNNNFMFDQTSEKIAFLDTLVTAEVDHMPKIPVLTKSDSLKSDSIKQIKNKSVKDSIPLVSDTLPKNTIHPLCFFKEQDSVQKVMNVKVLEKGCVQIIFSKPSDKINLIPIKPILEGNWFMKDPNETKDTVKFWIPDLTSDSLILRVTENEKLLDTLQLDFRSKVQNKKNIAKTNKFLYRTNLKNNQLAFFNPFVISSSRPVKEWDFSKISLKIKKDTTTIKTIVPSVIPKDSLHKSFEINYKWDEKYTYKLFIPPSVFKDILGFQNDTIQFSFKISTPENFGNLKIKVEVPVNDQQYLILLMDDKENVFKKVILSSTHIAEIKNIDPGNYRIRLVFDQNKNGKWDTGNYLKKIQPERVINYSEAVNVRANWDVDIDLKVK